MRPLTPVLSFGCGSNLLEFPHKFLFLANKNRLQATTFKIYLNKYVILFICFDVVIITKFIKTFIGQILLINTVVSYKKHIALTHYFVVKRNMSKIKRHNK